MARSIVVRYSKQLAAHFRANPKDAELWATRPESATEEPAESGEPAESEEPAEGWEV
jgi:hypothetical protein